MEKNTEKDYGARIERGRVTEVDDGKYRVASFCREGIITPEIFAIPGVIAKKNDLVLFCLFPDGDGMILAKL